MANYLRRNTMDKLQQERRARKQAVKQQQSTSCPYCQKETIEKHGDSLFCRECRRYI